MINEVRITNKQIAKDQTITFRLRDPSYGGFAIASVNGLDPGQSEINMIDIAGSDGSTFSSSRIPSRNIVLNMLVLDTYPTKQWNSTVNRKDYKSAVEYNRQVLYKYLSPKTQVTLTFCFETGGSSMREYSIDGYVEGLTVGLFSNAQSAQASIVCPNPYFKDLTSTFGVSGSYSNVVSRLTFPLEIRSPGIIFGTVTQNSEAIIKYPGSIETGYVYRLEISGECGDIQFTDTINGGAIKLEADRVNSLTGSPFTSGDRVTIDTRVGKKHITLTRSGHDYNILNSLSKNSKWLTLKPGENRIRMFASINPSLINVDVEADVLHGGL